MSYSLISYEELVELVQQGVIDAPFENINGASIDLTLGDAIMRENYGTTLNPSPETSVRLKNKEVPLMHQKDITDGYILSPGEFILATTAETFNLPNNIAAEYKLKSSLARSGLQHLLAGWCDPGWNNSKLTLELKNVTRYSNLFLEPGMKIGQVVFWKCNPVPEEHSYAVKGQYNDQETVTASKGAR